MSNKETLNIKKTFFEEKIIKNFIRIINKKILVTLRYIQSILQI
jgi:hypothetical protein